MTQTLGQAAILSEQDWMKLEAVSRRADHRLIWAISRYTAARIGEILKLRIFDAYDSAGRPLERIQFRRDSRKGKDKNHTVPVCPQLRSHLNLFKPDLSQDLLFPSPRCKDQPLSYEAVLRYLQKCAELAGLSHRKITTHCGRRSLITHLARNGTDLKTIQTISGHASLNNLSIYIEADPDIALRALSNLPK